MSAPDTRLEKQKRRHRGPLIGIALALLVAGGLLFGLLVYTADTDGRSSADPSPASQMPAEGGPVTPMSEPDTPAQVIDGSSAPTE